MTTMEPPESLLTQLDRVEPPSPWLILAGGVGSLLTETCTISPLGSEHQTHLPLQTPIRIAAPEGTGSTNANVQVRIFTGVSTDPESSTLVMLTGAGGPSHQVELRPDSLRIDDAAPLALGESGWLDLDLCLSAGAASTTVAHRGQVIRELELGAAPLELTVSPIHTEFDDCIATAAVRHPAPPETLQLAHALTHMTALVDRLDEEFSLWRSHDGATDALRPLEVFAARREVRRTAVLPAGRLEVLGFLSEGWQMRVDAHEWSYINRHGAPIDSDGLDSYGRAGGLVAYVYDRLWEMPPTATEDREPQSLESAGTELYSGDRAAWMAGMRNTETMLYQLATVWYLARQSGTASPEEATTTLHRALHELWHPAYAFHLDVVQILARAIGRFRFSDLQYTERSPGVLSELRDRLADQGIAARTVVLS